MGRKAKITTPRRGRSLTESDSSNPKVIKAYTQSVVRNLLTTWKNNPIPFNAVSEAVKNSNVPLESVLELLEKRRSESGLAFSK